MKEKTNKQQEEPTEAINEELENTKKQTEENIEAQEPTKSEEEKLYEKLEKANEKCAELNDKNLRLMAEFDNFRKRTLREKSELIKSAGEHIFIEMLELIDDFDRATKSIQSTQDPQAIKDGLELIHNKFIKFLKAHTVTEIETIGQPFDMEQHEAISMFAVEEKEKKGKIIDCISKGYKLNDKVIRFPKVIVGE